MKWIGSLKRMCKKPVSDSGKVTERVTLEPALKRKRVAWQWMLVSFLLTLLSVAYIFEIPFMVFDPTAFAAKNNGTQQQCSNGTAAPAASSDNSTVRPETGAPVTSGKPPPGKPPVMKRMMRIDLGFVNENGTVVPFDDVRRMKFTFLAGLTTGGILMGSLVDLIGRDETFKLTARVLIVFGFFMSICKDAVLLGICWFLVGFSCAIIYFMTIVNLMEKFAKLNEQGEPSEDPANRKARWAKYKYRLYLCIGFTCVWNFSRLYSLLVAWLTKDWTLICVWLTMIFAIVYFVFGDFFTDNYEDIDDDDAEKKKNDQAIPPGEEIDTDHFFVAIRTRPILTLNVFILVLNWFVCCHNLYGLVLGFKKISPNGNMFDNLGVANGFSFIALPIKFGVCIAARRKILPYSLLQLFSGVAILAMLAFPSGGCETGNGGFTSGKIFCAHVANVLISASLGILTAITIESFPDKYRMHGFGACVVFGRLGTMLGVGINDLGLFNAVPGPAIAGILSIVAAVLSRLLPDLTLSRLPKFQQEIERQQFPAKGQDAPEAPALPPPAAADAIRSP